MGGKNWLEIEQRTTLFGPPSAEMPKRADIPTGVPVTPSSPNKRSSARCGEKLVDKWPKVVDKWPTSGRQVVDK